MHKENFSHLKRRTLKIAALAFCCASIAFLLSGCGKQPQIGDAPPPNPTAFDNAAPEIKELWTQALEADKTNDYYRAQVILYEIIRSEVPPDQVNEARRQIGVFHERLMEGVKKGDAEAKAAYEKFRELPPSRANIPVSSQ